MKMLNAVTSDRSQLRPGLPLAARMLLSPGTAARTERRTIAQIRRQRVEAASTAKVARVKVARAKVARARAARAKAARARAAKVKAATVKAARGKVARGKAARAAATDP